MNKLLRSLSGLVLMFVLLIHSPSLAAAKNLELEQLNAAGCALLSFRSSSVNMPPHILDLSCDLGTEVSKLTIYSSRELDPSRPWGEQIDDRNATWLFKTGSQEIVSLIIHFHSEGVALIADLYDDQNSDGQVSYHTDGNQIIVDESLYWSVRVRAPDGWWQHSQIVNYNLEILTDGPVRASFGGAPDSKRLKNDGKVDFSILVGDKNENGRPEYQIVQLLTPFPALWAFPRTEMVVNPRDNEPFASNGILWAYLSSTWGVVQPYNKRQPPIQIDWSTARVTQISEFVASRSNDNNWFAYSNQQLTESSVSIEADFESPFAYYDLAEDADGYPELQVRLEVLVPGYTHSGSRFRTGRPITEARYSWDQDNNTTWDYKVGLLGMPRINGAMRVGDLNFRMADPLTLPQQVVGEPWSIATFVAAEKPYWTSEGIYEGSPLIYRELFAGLTDTITSTASIKMSEGLRGEYQLHYDRQPTLYFSPVDRKLHLLGAHTGLWLVDAQSRIDYLNTNGDDYVDQWRYTETITTPQSVAVSRQLNHMADYLVYSDDRQIILRKSNLAPSLFTTSPPTNHREWQLLGARLSSHQKLFLPDDFMTMFDQFEGDTTHIVDASIRDFRAVGKDGMRFTLELNRGFEMYGTVIDSLNALEPGSYVVTYDGAFVVTALTSPNIAIIDGTVEEKSFIARAPSPIQLQVLNTGTADARNLTLVAEARKGQQTVPVIQLPIEALAGQPTRTRFDWIPDNKGEWSLEVRIEDEQSNVLTRFSKPVTVVARDADSSSAVFMVSTRQLNSLPAASVLLLITILAGLTLSIIWHNRNKGGET